MSYLSQTDLSQDPEFQARVRGCSVQQATIFKDDARPDYVALAGAIMRQEDPVLTFFVLTAAAPGMADKGDEGTISDGDILAAVQAEWPTVAGLYYSSDGTPL